MMLLSLKTESMGQKIGDSELACRAIDIDGSLWSKIGQPLATRPAGSAFIERGIGGRIDAGHSHLRDRSRARRDSGGQRGTFRTQRQSIARDLNIHAHKKPLARDHCRAHPKMRIGAMGAQSRLPGLLQQLISRKHLLLLHSAQKYSADCIISPFSSKEQPDGKTEKEKFLSRKSFGAAFPSPKCTRVLLCSS